MLRVLSSAVKLADWRRAREEAIEQSLAELAQRPDDPDAAIKMHGTLEAYQQGEEAVRFAEGMLTLFGHVARVQFYLGGWYERVGRKEEADQCFARALALEPNHLPRYWAQFELRQAVKPPAGYNPIVADHDGYSLLCQALAWAERGNAAAAAEAKAQAIDQFRAGKLEDQRIAEILAKGDDWSEPDVQNLPVNLTHKCILLVAMAEKSSRRAAPLLELADKLNFERQFPYHFLKRTIDRLRKRSNAKLANH